MLTMFKITGIAVIFILLSACIRSASTKESIPDNNTLTENLSEGIKEIQNNDLALCEAPFGSLSIIEHRQSAWWKAYQKRHPILGSTEPLIQLIVAQSNCFKLSENQALDSEHENELTTSDYTLSPSVLLLKNNNVGIGVSIGGHFLGGLGQVIGGGISSNRSETRLTLIENNSDEPIAISVGKAKRYDMKFFGGLFGGMAQSPWVSIQKPLKAG